MTTSNNAENGALVSPEWLHERLHDENIVLVEVSGMGPADISAYGKGHLPGAVNWQWQETLWDAVKRDFPTPEVFAERMDSQGIGPQSMVVIYGEDIQFGSYAWWVLRYCGHDNVKLLDGGRAGWLANGYPLETAMVNPTPTQGYPRRERRESMRVMREAVLAHVNAGGLIIDARSPEEYSGERLSPHGTPDHGAVRYGRIPKAQHVYYRELVGADNRFKPRAQLEQILKEPLNSDAKVIAYCRMSHRGSFVYFALTEILGIERVQLYDGSWTEWGSLVGYPIEVGSG